MTEETNSAKEKNEDAQDKRPNLRRQILLWAAALLGGLTFFLLGRYVGWTGFYAFAVSCAVIPLVKKSVLRIYRSLFARWKWGLIGVGAAALGLLEGPDSFEWAVGWLRRYEKIEALWTFCWRIAVECLLVGLALSTAIVILSKVFKLGWLEVKKPDNAESSGNNGNESKTKASTERMIHGSSGEALKIYITGLLQHVVYSVIRPTILETLIFQAIPIALLSLAGASFGTQVVVSASLFALAHFTKTVKTGISEGIRGGVYFAFVYVHWKRTSFWSAFWVTALAHALNNLSSVALQMIILAGAITVGRMAIRKGADQKSKNGEEASTEAEDREEADLDLSQSTEPAEFPQGSRLREKDEDD